MHMDELPDELFAQLEAISDEANRLAEENRFEPALQEFQKAWALLPEPRIEWSAAVWILGSIGEMQFLLQRYEDARKTLQTLMDNVEDAKTTGLLCMRLGQSLFELGERSTGSDWLSKAYAIEGAELFEGEDPKYLEFVEPVLDDE
jgi:tetratricopeptide (TPR) repeat protein